MVKQNDAFQKRLLATFRIEADEHLKAMSSGLLELEKIPAGDHGAKIVEQVFREAHSLKGAARAVNLAEVESVCQALESVFAEMKRNRLAGSPALFDLLHQAIGALDRLVDPSIGASLPPPATATTLIQRLNHALQGQLHEPEPAAKTGLPEQPPAPAAMHDMPIPSANLAAETIRIATTKLDAVMRQVEELLSPRLASAQRAKELRESAAALAVWKKNRAHIQPALRQVEQSFARNDSANAAAHGRLALPKLLEYLDGEQLAMKSLDDRLSRLSKSADHDQRTLAGMTDSLLRDVREMHLLPFSSLIEIFPRFTRELARDQGKEVALTIQGGEIEIDRRILEEMKDPLLHMLRNCIDHGIETPALRADKHKPPHGTIALAISQLDSGKAEIFVTDDGTGIDAAKVKAAACKLGLVSAEEIERLEESAVLALIFQSGISTSPIITDVSGRGLGLAIVREKVEKLGGAIALESTPDTGTRFRITLPLTLATFRGVLVRVGEQLCVIPAGSVERVTRVARKDIRTVENRETIPLDGHAASLVWLTDVLEIPRKQGVNESAEMALAIVLGLGSARVAFRVDEILGEQEILLKPLGRQLSRVRNVAGACVLGTGQVAPVLNVADLMKSAVKQATAPRAAVAAQLPAKAVKPSILVVEDSITSRALLKNILEAAGYRVATAVDGIDAYTALKTETFALVVSDVEMPRMDGFDLTAKVRADKHFGELPIVLVTALGTREHRERGIDVGANAYIVKSSFDQSNLLETVRRLIY